MTYTNYFDRKREEESIFENSIRYSDFLAAEKEADSILDEKANIKSQYDLLFYNRFASEYEKKYGTRPYSINDPKVIKKFSEWLKKQSALLNVYADCLRRLKWAPRKTPTRENIYVELYKGDVDSLVKAFPEHITVLSNYATTIDPIKSKNPALSNSEVYVRNGVPSIKTYFCNKPVYLPYDPFVINSLYVHNPYSGIEGRRIESLLHNDDLSVVYGIYGLETDPQLEYKLIELSKLYEELLKDNQTTKLYKSGKEYRSDIGEYQMGIIYKPRK